MADPDAQEPIRSPLSRPTIALWYPRSDGVGLLGFDQPGDCRNSPGSDGHSAVGGDYEPENQL
jgi:hypothetical protein